MREAGGEGRIPARLLGTSTVSLPVAPNAALKVTSFRGAK